MINKYNGFKLISLELRNTTLMGKSPLFYNFIDTDDEQSSIYTTVLIGANGTGKSNLFRIIIELFKELNDLNKWKSRSYNVDGSFNLKYSINDNIYEYTNIDKTMNNSWGANFASLKINGIKADFSEISFPNAIVGNSIMLTDKYPFFKKEMDPQGNRVDIFPIYKYLGIRNIAQNASTRAYVRKTVEFIVEKFKSDIFIQGLKKATDFLGIDRSINIYYQTSNTSIFFDGKLNSQILIKYFENIKNKYALINRDPPFKLNHFIKINNNITLISDICNFCNRLVKGQRLHKTLRYSSSKKIVYDLLDTQEFEMLNSDFELLEHLRQLGMISTPEIELKRKDAYSIQESSSGEYHFLSSVIGLLATVESNSLVFIDEPEISLHPNWQMKYISFIRELFSSPEYATSHIFIATHSHFLISDLRAENSKIIGLKKDTEKIEIVDLPENLNTFGWSAEDVLYRVFSVRTTRNYYIEMDLRELLHLISVNSNDKDTLNSILNRIEKVRLNEADPLLLIIQKAKLYIQKL